MGSGVAPTMLIQGWWHLERLEGGDGVGGSCFEEEVAEGDILSSDVRAVTVVFISLFSDAEASP